MDYLMELSKHPFAEACFNDNDPHDLVQSLLGRADRDDCKTWGITPKQWYLDVALSIHARIQVFEDAAEVKQ